MDSQTTSYRDNVGADGRTYHYMLVVTDENGNENATINPDNTAIVSVTKAESKEASSQNLAYGLIAVVTAVVIAVVLVLFIRKRRMHVDPESERKTQDEIESGTSLKEGTGIQGVDDNIPSAEDLYKDDFN